MIFQRITQPSDISLGDLISWININDDEDKDDPNNWAIIVGYNQNFKSFVINWIVDDAIRKSWSTEFHTDEIPNEHLFLMR